MTQSKQELGLFRNANSHHVSCITGVATSDGFAGTAVITMAAIMRIKVMGRPVRFTHS
jgi:hypothetical protein